MRITIRNNAQLPNKYLRFIKWKFYNIKEKFQQLIYVEVFLNSEGQSPKTYIVKVKLGIPGNDIIINRNSEDLIEVFRNTSNAVHRYLAKNKELKIKKSINKKKI